MDRNHIDKIAKTPEDRVLLAKLWDKISSGIRKNVPANTCFLSPREQEMARFLFGQAEGVLFFGGYGDAERKMLVYLPDYLDESYLMEDQSPLVCLRASFYENDSLSHRDFLGALMGAGIARETVGDINVGTGCCDLLVSAEIAPYVLQNLTDAGRTKLHIQKIDLKDISIPQALTQQIRDTVASLRLDSVVATGFRMGRSQAAQYIAAGKVSIDGLPCEKPDRTVAEGQKISLRGAGKILLKTVGSQTKKGRITVVIDRYM